MKPILAKSRDTLDRFTDFDPATLYEAAGRTGVVDPAIRPAWTGAQGLRARDHRGMSAVRQPDAAHCGRQRSGRLRHRRNGGLVRVGGRLGRGSHGSRAARGVAGLVIDGAVRDIDAIEALQFPVFSRGLAIGSCTKERAGRLDVAIQFGGAAVAPGDLIFGNADGLVVIEESRIDEVYEAAVERRKKESEIIAKLRQGRTTLELLGLRDPRDGAERK